MCPSFLRLNTPLRLAMPRLKTWIGRAEREPPRSVKALDAVKEACAGGLWKGAALFAYERRGWSVFEDLSGGLAAIAPARWCDLAGADQLLFAGYNDCIPCGEYVHVERRELVRAFLHDGSSGELRSMGDVPALESWVDVAGFVDEDPIVDGGREDGLLWLFVP